MQSTTFDVKPASGGLGVEILGVDVTSLNDEQFDDIRQTYFDNGVIFSGIKS